MFYNRKLFYRFVFKLAVEIFLFCFHTKSRCLGNTCDGITVDRTVILDADRECNTALASVLRRYSKHIAERIAGSVKCCVDSLNIVRISILRHKIFRCSGVEISVLLKGIRILKYLLVFS